MFIYSNTWKIYNGLEKGHKKTSDITFVVDNIVINKVLPKVFIATHMACNTSKQS